MIKDRWLRAWAQGISYFVMILFIALPIVDYNNNRFSDGDKVMMVLGIALFCLRVHLAFKPRRRN